MVALTPAHVEEARDERGERRATWAHQLPLPRSRGGAGRAALATLPGRRRGQRRRDPRPGQTGRRPAPGGGAARRAGLREEPGAIVPSGSAPASWSNRRTARCEPAGPCLPPARTPTSCCRRLTRRFIPLYDYVLVSVPLTAAQWETIGWKRRQGITDGRTFFNYYRPTADGRVLWGTSEATYYRGNQVIPPATTRRRTTQSLRDELAAATFPRWRGLEWEYAWGGPICSTTRMTPFFGPRVGRPGHYGLGYTGHGLGTTRLAGRILAHLALDRPSELLDLSLVRKKPFPYPPEPLRSWAVNAVTSGTAESGCRRAAESAAAGAGTDGDWVQQLNAKRRRSQKCEVRRTNRWYQAKSPSVDLSTERESLRGSLSTSHFLTSHAFSTLTSHAVPVACRLLPLPTSPPARAPGPAPPARSPRPAAVMHIGGLIRSTLPSSPPLPSSTPISRAASSTCERLLLGRLLGLAVASPAHAEHEAHAAHVADQAMAWSAAPRAPALKRPPTTFAFSCRPVLLDHVQHREPRRHRDRIAAEGVEVDPLGRATSAISRRVVTAASGAPLPMPLAMVTMSGTTPKFWNPQ